MEAPSLEHNRFQTECHHTDNAWLSPTSAVSALRQWGAQSIFHDGERKEADGTRWKDC